ncbi:MAG: pirin family protein [Spirochaetes bacterium]|nr:pirin family protein [Spirochaetota bacterium]MBU1079479.1 pirin family protein [Spirochaetota bacterium]
MAIREAVLTLRGKETYDGAGVRLLRVFGHAEAGRFDPFLLLDAFGSDDPALYLPGFPMHPHRGIETVTYLLEGSVRHGDSLGSGGLIGPGDLQWMSAGSGIIHEEMPQESPRGVHGLQLWVNLPGKEKMRQPAYRGASAAEVPVVPTGSGSVRVLAGEWGGARGPVVGVARSPSYLDVSLDPGAAITLDAPYGRTAFFYVLEGAASTGSSPDARGAGDCVLLGHGDEVRLVAGPLGARLVIAHAPPIGEPIAWGGPIVMNTRAELDQAFRELDEGTFIRRRS